MNTAIFAFDRDSLFAIELEARRMRAKMLAAAGASFRRGLVRLFSRRAGETTTAARA